MPYTAESDWSKYDATQSAFLRQAVDKTLFEQMYNQGLIDQYNDSDADRFFTSVTDVLFESHVKVGK